MTLRLATPEQTQERISQWAQQVAFSTPQSIPIHKVGPENRASFYNARDFCHQHGATPIFGWSVHPETFLVRAHFCAVVKLNDQIFGVTKDPHGKDEMLFFEDRFRAPRYVMTHGAQIVHVYHSLVFPETKPNRCIQALSPEDATEMLLEAPIDMAAPKKSFNSNYPPVAPTRGPSATQPTTASVVHPALRSLKRYRR